MNGYFQIVINEKDISILLVPPTDGGKRIDIKEVSMYLNEYGITPSNPQLIIDGIRTNQTTIVPLMEGTRAPIHEHVSIKLTEDKMKAYMRLIPASNNGKEATFDSIKTSMMVGGVVRGINEEAIKNILKEKEYCKDYLVAKGREAVRGVDGRIEYMFENNLRARPTLNDDGSVDFYNLNLINVCKKGDILARLIKATPSVAGYEVGGGTIAPEEPKKPMFKFLKNVILSEDGCELIADVDGHVSLQDGIVVLSNVFDVDAVDTGTGNIDFNGSVNVKGNVCSGFRINAKGNVYVNGLVEGAIIEASGDVIIARGMNGRNTGMIKAGGNVISKYLENSTVIADGYIETEAAIYCKLSSGAQINVVGRKGNIIGGETIALDAVNVKNIGSPMGGEAMIRVGVDPVKDQRLVDIEADMAEIRKYADVVTPVLRAVKEKLLKGVKLESEQIAQFKNITEELKIKQGIYEAHERELKNLKGTIASNAAAVVKVEGVIYPGTEIEINGNKYKVKSELTYCRLNSQMGEVVVKSY